MADDLRLEDRYIAYISEINLILIIVRYRQTHTLYSLLLRTGGYCWLRVGL